MPSVSIIIATSGRLAALQETLASLSQVAVPAGFSVELLVVENGARHGAESLVLSFPTGHFQAVKYLFEPQRGKSRALNLALTQATGEILLFTDDDVRFPANWVGQLCEPIVAGQAQAVAGGVRLASHLLRPWMNHTHRAWLASTADYLSPEAPSEMCGANMAVSRRVLDQIGGFDPELGPGVTNGGEESLLSWQLQRAGFKIAPALAVEVEHHPGAERLRYQNWVQAARLKGRARAYLLHHWHHTSVKFPRLKQCYYEFKLRVRRACTGTPPPEAEGIAPWELSYLESIAMHAHYLQERQRRRNYPPQGLRKLNLD